MAENVEGVLVLRREDSERPAFSERRDQVLHLAVDFHGKRILEEPLADRADHFTRQNSLLDLASGAVGER
jgi:hypothetical protein